MEVATVRIVDEEVEGGRLINVADFDPDLHEPFDDAEAEKVGMVPADDEADDEKDPGAGEGAGDGAKKPKAAKRSRRKKA